MRKKYVSFTLGPGRYCVFVDQVVQILRPENILDVPKAPPYVDGVINLRGDVVPVVNLRARLGIRQDALVENPPSSGPASPRAPGGKPSAASRARIVVTRVGSRFYGLSVDEVREIVDFDEGGIQADAADAPSARPEFIQGVALRDSVPFFILDLSRVVGASRDLQAAGTEHHGAGAGLPGAGSPDAGLPGAGRA